MTLGTTNIMAEEPAAMPVAEAPAPAAAPAADKVVATVNGSEITSKLLDKVLEQVPPSQTATPTEDMKKEILNKIIDLELVSQAAIKDGLDKDADFVAGLEMFKKQQLFAIYLNKAIIQTVKVTPEEANANYEANKDTYKTGEEVRASHILVDTEEKAKNIKERLDKGEVFEELAKAESSCPSASRGGDLGSFGKGSMVPEFEQAAFALKEGEVSGPVKTQFGYHIIKVTGHKASGVQPFEEVKEKIEQSLLQEKQQKAYDDLLVQMRKAAAITINDTALGAK